MKVLNKILIVSSIALVLFMGIPSSTVHAVGDETIASATMTSAQFKTIYDQIVTFKGVQWPNQFDYAIYKSTANTYSWYFFSKGQSNLVLGDNTVDAPWQNNIDKWYIQATCTGSNLCQQYNFNTSGAYVSSFQITSNINLDITTGNGTFWLYYANIPVYTTASYFDPTCEGTTRIECFSKIALNPVSYGVYTIPAAWMVGYVTPTTDQAQTDQLITANWGMLNGLKEGLNIMFGWVIDGLVDLLEGTNNMSISFENSFFNWTGQLILGIADAFTDWFVPKDTVLVDFAESIAQWDEPLLFIDELKSFFDKIGQPGSRITAVSGTVLGTPVSIDMKQMFFDPFLPVAPFMKNVFSFVLWALFMPRLFKEVQGLINGQVV